MNYVLIEKYAGALDPAFWPGLIAGFSGTATVVGLPS